MSNCATKKQKTNVKLRNKKLFKKKIIISREKNIINGVFNTLPL